MLLALSVWAWFSRDMRGIDDPRVVAETSAGGTARSGPSSFRLDGFTIAAALPGPEGQVSAPAGTRFVEVRITQTLVGAFPSPETYYCEYDLVDAEGRRWDGHADELGDVRQKGESPLCQDAPPEHPLVRDRPRPLVFRFVVPAGVSPRGMRLWQGTTGEGAWGPSGRGGGGREGPLTAG